MVWGGTVDDTDCLCTGLDVRVDCSERTGGSDVGAEDEDVEKDSGLNPNEPAAEDSLDSKGGRI
jgi:hypothetical protein